jgi:hypothetical protein
VVQEMWKKDPGSTEFASNQEVADPSSFRKEMTVFAPRFGGYDQVKFGCFFDVVYYGSKIIVFNF